MSSSIVIDGLKKSFPAGRRNPGGAESVVFDNLRMHIAPGELVALVGPSGCGKSTLLNLIAGLDTPTNGAIRFDAQKPSTELSVVFQQPRLIDWLTVEQNVSLVFERIGGVVNGPSTAAETERVTHALLAKVGLQTHAKAYPQYLSGGQKQRVAIARAFAVHPDILLLDEPFSALDELTARRLRLLLQDMWLAEEDHRPTGVLVTHNMLEAAFLADRIYVIGRQSGGFSAIIDVDLPRPRTPDDPALFEVHRSIMQALD